MKGFINTILSEKGQLPTLLNNIAHKGVAINGIKVLGHIKYDIREILEQILFVLQRADTTRAEKKAVYLKYSY